jgi:hypothetical protein
MKHYPATEAKLFLAFCIFSLGFVAQIAAQSSPPETARKTVVVDVQRALRPTRCCKSCRNNN